MGDSNLYIVEAEDGFYEIWESGVEDRWRFSFPYRMEAEAFIDGYLLGYEDGLDDERI